MHFTNQIRSVEMKAKRVSISLDKREFHTIESIRIRHQFTDKYFPYLPEMKELLEAMIYFTKVTVEGNKNSLRSFINAISNRKSIPILTEDELSEENPGETPSYNYEENSELYQSQEKTMPSPKTRSYILTLEEEDEKNIESIRNLMRSYAKIDVKNIRDSDIIKESLSFITGHKWRNVEFFHFTYIGNMYDLEPLTALKIFRPSKDVSFSKIEKELISDITKDKKVFEKYSKSISGLSFPSSLDELEDFIPMSATSESGGGFNYGSAVFGFWLVSRTLPYNLTTFSLSSIMSLLMLFDEKYKIETDKRWKERVELFISLVEYILKESQDIIEKN